MGIAKHRRAGNGRLLIQRATHLVATSQRRNVSCSKSAKSQKGLVAKRRSECWLKPSSPALLRRPAFLACLLFLGQRSELVPRTLCKRTCTPCRAGTFPLNQCALSEAPAVFAQPR